MKRENGITLIALIITIIILVILATVSIRAVANMGIVRQAVNGTQDYARQAKAENQMLGETTNTIDSTLARINEIQGENGGSENNYGGTTPENQNNSEEPETTAITVGETAPAGGGTYLSVPIPAGFTVSGVSGEATSIEEGIVIYDIPSNVDTTVTGFWTADIDNNGAGNGYLDVQENYNQFVWVPVTTPYVTQASLQTLIDDTTKTSITDEKTALQSLVDSGTYPMAVQYTVIENEGTEEEETVTNYRGVLYKFTAGTSGITMTVRNFSTTADYTTVTYYREPAYLAESTYYADGCSTHNPGTGEERLITQKKLQDEYNAMIEKVANAGGFYVARYELSYNSTKSIGESKRAKTVTTANSTRTRKWYGLYSACRGMYNQSTDPVQSIMITGAQYDQILIWMRNVTNVNVSSKYYILDSTGMGNYKVGSDSNIAKISGYDNAYEVKKVFDIGGNLSEWTSEALNVYVRALRGGNYSSTGSDCPTAYRDDGYCYPSIASSTFSSRTTLYIK